MFNVSSKSAAYIQSLHWDYKHSGGCLNDHLLKYCLWRSAVLFAVSFIHTRRWLLIVFAIASYSTHTIRIETSFPSIYRVCVPPSVQHVATALLPTRQLTLSWENGSELNDEIHIMLLMHVEGKKFMKNYKTILCNLKLLLCCWWLHFLFIFIASFSV